MWLRFQQPRPKPAPPTWLIKQPSGQQPVPGNLEIRLTAGDLKAAFEPLGEKYPPILSLEQAAELLHLAPGTLKRKVSEGAFAESVKRGKPLRFWRDLLVKEALK